MRFPTIPHLFGSASDPGDVVLSAEQTRAFLRAPVLVQEKFDGLNVGLCFTTRGALRFVSREHGLLSADQLGPGLWPLLDFAWSHLPQLLTLLGTRLALFGEWLAGPRRLAYPRRDADFLGFDLFDRASRAFLPAAQARRRIARAGLQPVPVVFRGRVGSVGALLGLVPRSAFGGRAEGVVVLGAGGQRAKVVRPAWAKLQLRAPAAPRPTLPSGAPGRATFRKRFPAARGREAALEATLLRGLAGTGVAPRLHGEEGSAGGVTTLVTSLVPGHRFPANASPALAASLGAQLRRLHAVRAAAPPLPGGPGAHVLAVSRDVRARRLAGFLAAQRAPVGQAVLCHADLKSANLRVQGGAVTLLDFERARWADPAWELACAMDRLELGPAARAALLEGYGERSRGFALRVQCFRRAWDFVLPRAVRALERESGRQPGETALRLAAMASARAARLRRALASFDRAVRP